MRRSKLKAMAMAALAMLFLCGGCAGLLMQGQGKMVPDGEVTVAFERYQINPDFNYYVSGSDAHPNALLGLDKTYALDADLWKRIEPTRQSFRETIQRMQMKALDIRQQQHGFAILDGQGRPIGVWYSILRARQALRIQADRKVFIYTPDPDTYGDLREK